MRARASCTASISSNVIVLGARMSIAFDVVPKEGMHVYAPGTQYPPGDDPPPRRQTHSFGSTIPR